jgi:glycosyltransferase involved in cell wall biosynthesis
VSIESNDKSRKILVVARWPLGGIRTYMRYVFPHFPKEYSLTILASSTQENDALERDTKEYGARLLLTKEETFGSLVREAYRELKEGKYDIILSQGFISAVAVYLANIFSRRPHILTIHGIVEPKYLTGRFGNIKSFLLGRIFSSITVLYAVSNDILEHLYEQFPVLKTNASHAVVIPNGIEMTEFLIPEELPCDLRERLNIPPNTVLFGFFGRFMQQKGFDLLIDAVEILKNGRKNTPFAVLAVGSGDYLSTYQATINKRNLGEHFIFLPFQSRVKDLYLEANTIVMPSRWEACPLQPMEALSLGVPLIASDCIGLRETISNTPARVFHSEDVSALAKEMSDCMVNPRVEEFKAYVVHARARFDVSCTARQLVQLIEKVLIY